MLLSLNDDVLFITLSMLTWYSIKRLRVAFQSNHTTHEQMTNLLLKLFSKQFPEGVAKRKNKNLIYTIEDLNWFFKQLDETEVEITQTCANVLYAVTTSQLQNVDCVWKRNPKYQHKSAPSLPVYNRLMVIRLCLKRHGNVNGLLKHQKKLEINRNKRPMGRKQILMSALAQVGLEIRDDSKYCAQFIAGVIPESELPCLVHTMCKMKFVHEYCSKQFNDNKLQLARELKRDKKWLQRNWNNPIAHEQFRKTWNNYDFVQGASYDIDLPERLPWIYY